MNLLLVIVLFAPVRDVQMSPAILADVQSHLAAGNVYWDSDVITCTHESSHGIASVLRQKYGKPGFYLLNNEAALIEEPKTTISAVAREVPSVLRGEVFQLYLVDSRRWWDEQPSYIFDELVAYTNGSLCREQAGIESRQETVRYATEFIVYSICVARVANDLGCREFLRREIETTIRVSRRSQIVSPYFTTFQTHPDAEPLREWTRNYFGAEWCKAWLAI